MDTQDDNIDPIDGIPHDVPISRGAESPGDAIGPETEKVSPQTSSKSKPPPQKPLKDESAARQLRLKIQDLNHRFLLKERLQLGYIYEDFPRSYYRAWKVDGNNYFSLIVNLKRRLKELEAKSPKISRQNTKTP